MKTPNRSMGGCAVSRGVRRIASPGEIRSNARALKGERTELRGEGCFGGGDLGLLKTGIFPGSMKKEV